MKVLVTVAEVASVADNFEIEDGSIDERFVGYDLNEWDEYAIEAAVSLREAGIAEEVITLTIGPPRAEDTIRMALAKEADRAIRVWEDDLADGALDDVSVRAALMAPVIEEENPGLVLSGVQAADDGYGATGVRLARRLGWQWAAVIKEFSLTEAGVRVRRELEGGLEEIVHVERPAVLTVQSGINDPRYASLRGLQAARDQEIPTYTPADLEVPARAIEPAVHQGELREPPSTGETEFVEGDPETQAAAIADWLVDEGVLEE